MRKICDIQYGNICPEKQMINLYLPDCDEFPVFIYFHGGGLENDDRSEAEYFAQYLTDNGIAVVSADYRTYPEAVYPDFLKDGAAAIDWTYKNISKYGKCARIYVGGTSAGAYLSMMLCMDGKYLAPYKIKPEDITAYVFASPQPTTHFNVLRERGVDSKRIIVDDAAPLYHVGRAENYSPMLIIVSDNDIECRLIQNHLVKEAMTAYGHGDKVEIKLMSGTHCSYVFEKENNTFARIAYEYITKIERGYHV